jgi:hypothetical protein
VTQVTISSGDFNEVFTGTAPGQVQIEGRAVGHRSDILKGRFRLQLSFDS